VDVAAGVVTAEDVVGVPDSGQVAAEAHMLSLVIPKIKKSTHSKRKLSN
jgi:hypothetical protein